MKKVSSGLLVALFAAISIAGAHAPAKLPEAASSQEKKPKRGFAAVGSLQPRSYRSASRHKVVVASEDREAIARMQQAGAKELADYGSFRVFLWQAQKADADRQELALAE